MASDSVVAPTTSPNVPPSADDDRQQMVKGLLEFVDKVALPLEKQASAILEDPRQRYDDFGNYAPTVLELRRTIRQRAAEAGFYTMCVAEKLGGGGQGPLVHFLAWEALFHRYGPAALLPFQSLAHWAQGPSDIFQTASPPVRDTVLPALMSGDKTMCFSLSEPDAGSDAWNLRTTARLLNGKWILNGTKQWSTNGGSADYALVFAVTDRQAVDSRAGGITAFVVPTSSPGFRVDSIVRMFGSIGGEESIISLNDVQVDVDWHLGEIDNGFLVALSGISLGRMYNAGRAIGLSRWALERAVHYANERRTFGNPIAEYQGIQFLLADTAMTIYASRTMALDCAQRIEMGRPVRKELAMVKAFTSEGAFRCLDNCMQIFGAMGLTNELAMVHGWHQVRSSRIADGSGEIMRRTIARRLLRGDLTFT